MLSNKTIAIVRSLLARFSRGDIPSLMLEAGANRERVMAIPVVGDMRSSDYRSKSTILNEAFDRVFADFPELEANHIVLDLIRSMARANPALFAEENKDPDALQLRGALAADGYELKSLITPQEANLVSAEAIEAVEKMGWEQAAALLRKAVSRLSGDEDGAITAGVSALEATLKAVYQSLRIELPTKQQLPDLLVHLRKNSNVDGVLGFEDAGKRVISSLAGLLHNLYQLSHEAGDRHGSSPKTKRPSHMASCLFVNLCSSCCIFLSEGLAHGELKSSASGGGETAQ
jgi:HEPN domain-containing protein